MLLETAKGYIFLTIDCLNLSSETEDKQGYSCICYKILLQKFCLLVTHYFFEENVISQLALNKKIQYTKYKVVLFVMNLNANKVSDYTFYRASRLVLRNSTVVQPFKH